ncbi:MAG: hypothetical protein KY461_01400 [Actinobacteria bacterium]|nr:hypothetical protein [Actinomycetota bacterium]
MTRPASDAVTVHTSWRGVLSSAISPVVLLGYGLLVLSARGPAPVALVALVVGVGLAGVALFDYPRRTEFSPEGIRRVCPLRDDVLPWSRTVAIERAPGSVRSAIRLRGDDTPKAPTGGLVARGLGRRRHLLSDRVESRREYDELEALLDGLDVTTVLRAGRPGADVPPTDLYRRRAGHRSEDRT